jgi:threonine/homoserine/homoserine lactone efflux protein
MSHIGSTMGEYYVENVLLRGLAIGFAIAAPIGPVGILCVRRALSHGRLAGISAAMGAAFADCFFGAAVGLGIGSVQETLAAIQTPLRIVGGLFLLVLGVRLCKSAGSLMENGGNNEGTWIKDALSSFAITITNPGTILGVIGVFAALGPVGQTDGFEQSSLLIGGIFMGSLLWWTTLSSIASAVRGRVSAVGLCRFGWVSGASLVVFGAVVLGSVVWGRPL